MRIHSRKDQRFLCTECHKTCSATTGTALSRLRTSAETVPLVVTLLAQGCPLQAMVVAFGDDERTVASWVARAGVHGQAVQEPVVEHPRNLGEGHADARRVKKQGGMVWMALAMMVSTRLWLAGEVSAHRDMALMRHLLERVRRGAAHRALLCCTDGLCTDVRAMRETFRDVVRTGERGRPRLCAWDNRCMAPVVTRDATRRVVEVERRILQGSAAHVERLRDRPQGDGVINTASIERLTATFRERLGALTRRGRAVARSPSTWQHGMDLSGTVSNFCTPHESLPLAQTAVGEAWGKRTPAMAAGITDHGWSVRALLSFHVPPPRWTPPTRRGRPSRALHYLRERWCS